MHYRADVTKYDPNIISKYLSEPGSGIHPLLCLCKCRSCHSAEQAHFVPPPPSCDLRLYDTVVTQQIYTSILKYSPGFK